MILGVLASAIVSVSANAQRKPPPPVVVPHTPVQSIGRYGAWSVVAGRNTVDAFTGNGSGSVFGVICGTSCVAYVGINKNCADGDTYPALINSDNGGYAIDLKCLAVGDQRLLIIGHDFVDYLDGKQIGVAVPLENGLFAVSRFSLSGAIQAVRVAMNRASARQQSELRDFTL